MNKTGIWLSHPFFENSFANQFIVNNLLQNNTDINLRHIDTLYPNGFIDREEEQSQLLKVDTIILQFPIFWYHCPASMKNWLDTILSIGFAFGHKGDKLQGKNFIISVTTGGPSNSYTSQGYNNHTIQEYLYSLKQIAYFTKMSYRGTIVSYDIKDVDTQKNILEKNLKEHITLLQNISETTLKNVH